eukprot:6155185-Amphidinium_carterae.1
MRIYAESFFGIDGILISYDTVAFLPDLVLQWDQDHVPAPGATSERDVRSNNKSSATGSSSGSKVPLWLQSFVAPESSDPSCPDIADSDAEDVKAEELFTDDVDVGFKDLCSALEKRKGEWETTSTATDWFHEALCEDKRLLAKKGDTIHATLITVKKDTPMYEFVHKLGLPKSGRFETSVYTEEGAAALTKLFTARLMFLFGLLQEHGTVSAAFQAEHLSKWTEPPGIASFREQWSKRALARCDKLNRMVPELS